MEEDFSYLFAGIGRQVEGQNSQKRDAHTGNDEIDGVEERLASHRDVERNVQIGFVAARVEFHVPFTFDLVFYILNVYTTRID